jgi:sulfonate transport system ATP-binding protein
MEVAVISLKLREKRFKAHRVLSNINLQISAGDRIALLGPSGVGKTTLLRIIAGLDRAFTGEYTPPQKIALMFQEPNLLPWRTVFDNLKIFHPTVPATRIAAQLQEVGLDGKAEMFPNQLSLGQQRRLSLLRAFIAPADLVLLDEPFASLDDDTSVKMRQLTKDLLNRNGSALVLVTHNTQDAKEFGAAMLTLSGSPATLTQCS